MRESSPSDTPGKNPDAYAPAGQAQDRPPEHTPAYPINLETTASTGPTRTGGVHNRLAAVLEHVARYSIDGPSRIAADTRLSHSAVSRLMHGHSSPSFRLVCALTAAIERQLGKRIDPRDLVSVDGTFLTDSACELCGCDGCLPTHFYNDQDDLKPEYRDVKPGEWSRSRPAQAVPASGITAGKEGA